MSYVNHLLYCRRKRLDGDIAVGVNSVLENGTLEIGTRATQSWSDLYSDLPFNPMNEAEAVAEKEIEMGAELSAYTFETIEGMQELLAKMLETQERCCKK